MEKDYNLSLYDIKSLKKLFRNNSVVAYGNGSFFNKIKEHLKLFNLEFVDILYTQNDKIVSTSGKSYEDIAKKSVILICSSFSSEILKTLKNQKTQPKNIKIATFLVISDEELNLYKQELARIMQKRHKIFIQNLKGKEKIKVLFLVLLDSVWKVDPVFKKMLDDPYFEPVIFVIPFTSYGEERMWEEMTNTYEYFKEKGYPIISSYNKDEDRWISLEEIKPDIVFFTNPHNLTRKEYYEDAYLNYLSCYAGYGINTSKNLDLEYNQVFHSAIWKIFVQIKDMQKGYFKYSQRKNYNVELVIDNIVEEIINPNRKSTLKAWKRDDMLKIIIAPHHRILDTDFIQTASFIKYADFFIQLAKHTKNEILWSFKPHPILKSKLYKHPKFGINKTDQYYKFWEEQENTQLNEGEYIDLFLQSDCMILDSYSFLAEYTFTQKPMLFLMKDISKRSMSNFGISCLKVNYQAFNKKDIENFIKSIKLKKDLKLNSRKKFVKDYFKILGKNNTSNYILESIKNSLKISYQDLEKQYGGFWNFKEIKDFYFLVNPYFPSKKMQEEIKENLNILLSSYPSGLNIQNKLAGEMFNILPNNILVGNGSAELIRGLCKILYGNLGIVFPTFNEYPESIGNEKVKVFKPKSDFKYTAENVINFSKKIDNLLLINPDNPSGNFITKSDVIKILKKFKKTNKNLIIDESFIDFAKNGENETLIEQSIINNYPNLIIIKSIGKSYGVPGIRLGVLISSNIKILSDIKKLLPIWNINSFGEFFLQVINKYKLEYTKACFLIRQERDRFYDELTKINFLKVISSQSNYFMCEVLNLSSLELVEMLFIKYNIFIKNLSSKRGLENKEFIRIAVKSKKENDYLISILKKLEAHNE